MLLGFRPEIRDEYIFRRAVRTPMGYQMSSQPLELPTMGQWISTIGVLAGFEHATYAYTLRYMAGNKLNQDGMFITALSCLAAYASNIDIVNISDDLLRSVLDHGAGSDAFFYHYMNRTIDADLLAISRGLTPQKNLVHLATSHGHSVSSRRPVRLTDKDHKDLEHEMLTDAEYQRLTKRLADFSRTSVKYREIFNKRRAHVERLKRAKLKQIRDEWSFKQGVLDAERQSRGEDISQITYTRPAPSMSAKQQHMMDALEAPLVMDLDAQNQRRVHASNALVAYCGEEEAAIGKLLNPSPAVPMDPDKTPQQQMETIKQTTLVSVMGDQKVDRCFICVANAESLGQIDHPRFAKLCHEFAGQAKLNRHFIRCHLDYMEETDTFKCPICQVALLHKDHLRNHAYRIHGINTNIKFKRPPKKEVPAKRRSKAEATAKSK